MVLADYVKILLYLLKAINNRWFTATAIEVKKGVKLIFICSFNHYTLLADVSDILFVL